MPKTITQQTDIGRAPQDGDLFVADTPTGTKKIDFSRFKGKFTPKKHIFKAVGGETEVVIPGFDKAYFSLVWQSFDPLDETAAAIVPEGYYKPDYPLSKIILGNEAGPGEKIVILYF